MKNSVIFFGSGPVASESLRLLSEFVEVEAVITKPSTEKQMESTVPGVPIYTVSNRGELDQLIASSSFKSTLGILIDFGIIVSQTVIDSFKLGIINSHFSILPQWRGADPISFAILSGQDSTGVSLMLLTAGMDEGPLLGFAELKLDGTETTPVLTKSLIQMSNQLLQNELPMHFEHPTEGAPQEATEREISYSRKLTKEDGIIDWNKPADVIEREIRAFIEWPKSRTTLGGKDIIITSAHTSPTQLHAAKAGDIDTTSSSGLGVVTASGTLWIDSLKPAGKKEMTAQAFLAGYRQLL